FVGAGQAGAAGGVELSLQRDAVGDGVWGGALEGAGEQALADGGGPEGENHLAAGGAVDGRPPPEPVHADDRGRAGRLLDGDDLVAGEDVEGDRLTEGRRESGADGPGERAEVGLAGDHARELGEALAQPILRALPIAF